MKFFFWALTFFYLLITSGYSSEIEDCSKYNKLSPKFYKCKTGNFVKSTKNYQTKEWSDEKKKVDKIKKKVLEK